MGLYLLTVLVVDTEENRKKGMLLVRCLILIGFTCIEHGLVSSNKPFKYSQLELNFCVATVRLTHPKTISIGFLSRFIAEGEKISVKNHFLHLVLWSRTDFINFF